MSMSSRAAKIWRWRVVVSERLAARPALVPDAAPGVPGGVLDDADQQQRQPAEPRVGADAVLAEVEHRNTGPAMSAPFRSRQPRSTW